MIETKLVKVRVTKDDIKKARRYLVSGSGRSWMCRCPIARALSRRLGKTVYVGRSTWGFKTGNLIYSLEADARAVASRADRLIAANHSNVKLDPCIVTVAIPVKRKK